MKKGFNKKYQELRGKFDFKVLSGICESMGLAHWTPEKLEKGLREGVKLAIDDLEEGVILHVAMFQIQNVGGEYLKISFTPTMQTFEL